MRISKHTFQDYCNDDKYAQKLMSLVAAKLPTKTMQVTHHRRYNTSHANGMVYIATVDAMDVLHLCDRMLATNHPKVKKDTWIYVREVATSEVNKMLAQC